MTTRYVTTKTADLRDVVDADTKQPATMKLIFGDEVEVTGPAQGDRAPARFRGRDGLIDPAVLGSEPALEVYFIDVGQGDSTFIVTPDRHKILVDGGKGRNALAFLSWKYMLDEPGPDVVIDLMVLSHADGDHVDGLAPILRNPRIKVKRIVHNGIGRFTSGTFAEELGDLVKVGGQTYLKTLHDGVDQLPAGLEKGFGDWISAVKASGAEYGAVCSATGKLPFADPGVTLEVAGPRVISDPDHGSLLPWLKDATHTINGNSVVLRLTCGDVRVLLSGDVNIGGSDWLLDDPTCTARLDAHVLKAPHHGSHEFTVPFLQAVAAQIAVVSSGDETDHGHPRAKFLGAIGRTMRSEEPLLFSTELAGNFIKVAAGKEAAAPSPPGADAKQPAPGAAATIAAVDPTAKDAAHQYRQLYRRRLWGMINVRSDGSSLYAARRIVAAEWWESYGPDKPAPRP